MIDATVLLAVVAECDEARAEMHENGSRLYLEDQPAYEALFNRCQNAESAFTMTARKHLREAVEQLRSDARDG